MLLSFLLWAGAFTLIAAPMMAILRRTRRWALRAALTGLVAILIAIVWPARENRIASRQSRIDEFMPVWQFDEAHAIHVDATPERVFPAVHAVTPREIRLFRTLIMIRRFGRPQPANILNAPADEPLLQLATRTSFRYLADDAPREIVVGTRVAPGVTAVMNFLIAADATGGSHVSTETRVFARTARARRLFAIYWRVIRPGSGIIRRMWLRAIKLRAEAA